jgi:hypothetical protein
MVGGLPGLAPEAYLGHVRDRALPNPCRAWPVRVPKRVSLCRVVRDDMVAGVCDGSWMVEVWSIRGFVGPDGLRLV